mgnify:CR=1 FL=1
MRKRRMRPGFCAACGRPFIGRSEHCSRPCWLSPASRAARFWRKVDASAGLDACWPWRVCRDRKSYGLFSLDGRKHCASRVAWILTHGDPGSLDVLHHCDNPPCVNPAHLFLGDAHANLLDAAKKGRLVTKLTTAQAREIRELARIGALAQRAIARRYGVSQPMVSSIKRGKRWEHA